MMGKISLYGTVIPIVLILLVGFILIGGWKYFLLIAGIVAAGKLLSKFLSNAWVNPILFLLFIAGMHYLIQDIYVTMIFAFSLILMRLIEIFINNKKIESVLAFIVMFSAALILEYSEELFHKEVEVSEAEVYPVEQEFAAVYDVVEYAVIKIEEKPKRITLHFAVERADSIEEIEGLGKNFAEMVSIEISETQEIEGSDKESYGDLFVDYDLRIIIREEETRKLSTGSKGTNEAEISWYVYEINY